ncbi:MAG: hypothetical protein JWP11_3716 [Frankiales bacterium]|nr:hypothetical protein [Frankiales bacterium]
MTAPARATSPDVTVTPIGLGLVQNARRLVTATCPTADDRRNALRKLALTAEDEPEHLLSIAVAAIADRDLTPTTRAAAWDDLLDAVSLLTGLDDRSVDPRLIAPGANPHSAFTVAREVLDLDIARALVALVALATGTSADAATSSGVA